MPRTIPYPDKGVLSMAGVNWAFGRAVTTTSGTLSTATQGGCWPKSPLVISKVAATAGRYKILLPNPFMTFLWGGVLQIGPNTAVYGANTTGLDYFWRQENIDSVQGTTVDGSILLQFTQTSYADAELPDGTIFQVMLALCDGT
jgi:hypothetical protein